jgi:hypothetical protein
LKMISVLSDIQQPNTHDRLFNIRKIFFKTLCVNFRSVFQLIFESLYVKMLKFEFFLEQFEINRFGLHKSLYGNLHAKISVFDRERKIVKLCNS